MSFVKPVSVEGMKDLQRALRDLDGESQKELRLVLNEVAATVAQGASRRVPTRTGHARASIKAKSSQRESKVAAGGRKAPYYAWLDFGGRVGRKKATERPVVAGGRYLYPTVAANRASLAKALAAQLEDLARRKGLA